MDVLKKGEVTAEWEKWAEGDAVKFIADGSSRTEIDFFSSGMVAAGECIGILRAFSPGWDFLDKDIVDIGCGIGRHAAWFRRVFRSYVYGIDVSGKMISKAKESANGVDFRVCKTETRLPLPDDSIDFAFSLTVFQHNPRENVKAILKDLHRVMRKGGLTVIQLPVVSDPGKVAYPTTANRTAVWYIDEFMEAIKGLFTPVRLATDRHFGYHIMRPIK